MSRKFLVIRYLYGGNQYDSKGFLSSLVNKPGWAPVRVKLPQTGRCSSYRYSIYYRSYSGPTFGRGFDIYISNYASHNNDSFTELGHTYSSVFTQFGSLRASSPGRSGGEAGKGRSQSARRACLQAIRVSGGSFHCSNSDEFCDTAPLSKPFGMFETMRSLSYNKLAV